MNEEEPLRRHLKTIIKTDERAEGDHLGEDQMLAFYRHSELPGEAEYSVRDHLAECERCIRLYKDVRDFLEPRAPEEMSESSVEAAAAWNKLRGQLAAPNVINLQSHSRKKRRFSDLFLIPALAAAVLLVTALGAVWVARLKSEQQATARQLESDRQSYLARLNNAEQENERLRAQAEAAKKEYEDKLSQQKRDATGTGEERNAEAKPGPRSDALLNVPLIDVFPVESVQRSAGPDEGHGTDVPYKSDSFVLILNAAGQADYPTCRVEISDLSNRIIWRGSGLKKDQTGNFTIMLSRIITPPGSYTIRLYSQASGNPVAEYKFNVK